MEIAPKSVRILLIGHNGPGSGKILTKVVEQFPNAEILVAVTQGLFYKTSTLQSMTKLLVEASWLFVVLRALDFLVPSPHTLARVCKVREKRFFTTRDINSQFSIQRIREFEPDIIVSTFTMHIVGTEVISLSRMKSIGVHPSILPNYRGLEVFFWMMANGESEGGTSTYELVSAVDSGPLLMQESWPIGQPDSVENVYEVLTLSCANLVCETIERVVNEEFFEYLGQQNRTGSYFPMPTRAAMKLFRSRGHRWSKFRSPAKSSQIE